jgi:tetratricopeptide (TPR) repeat protein
MSVKYTVMSIKGSDLPKENPLPFYKSIERNSILDNMEGFKVHGDEEQLFGYETAPRYLPYKIQDKYSRKRSETVLKVIVMENDILKATFLPEYGGRLYSLYHKQMEKELLFKNEVIQPGNLAILNAWISGGIEWNVGQYGHSFTTCSPLFCAVLKDDNGEEFIRMYEYERCHNYFWHLDFHLPQGSNTLSMYVRIINDNEEETSMYYWSNIAVKETKKLRVFSNAEDVIYLDAYNNRGFARGKMPYMSSMPDKDASYPANYEFSNEYFFQTAKEDKSAWEAAVYPDNWLFFERSSSLLRFRKMFCWGDHHGGQRWKDYLSEDGKGDYVEIQGGFAPTQLHGMVMEGKSTLEFVQCFGGANKDTVPYYHEDWKSTKNALRDYMDEIIPEDYVISLLKELGKYASKSPEDIIHFGSGYAALEAIRREKHEDRQVPEGFCFPHASMTMEQCGWLHLLEHGYLPVMEATKYPLSYLIQPEWYDLLHRSLKINHGQNWLTYLHLSIIHMELGEYKEAQEMAEKSIEKSPNALAYRNVALLEKMHGNMDKVQELYKLALSQLDVQNSLPLLTEYFHFLLSVNREKELWECYNQLPVSIQEEERIFLCAVKVALRLEQIDFVPRAFEREYAYIRENETKLSELWLEYYQRIEGIKQQRSDISFEEVERMHPIPRKLDFRTV